MRLGTCLAGLVAGLFLIGAGPSQQAIEGTSGLKVPRFVSLSAGLANMRAGPGENYPVTWVYQRKGLPVEVVAEYNIWRQVRDVEGVTGWFNKNLIAGKRTALVRDTLVTGFAEADERSRAVFRLEAGVSVPLLRCKGYWCRVEAGGRKGYVPRRSLWGLYPGEDIED